MWRRARLLDVAEKDDLVNLDVELLVRSPDLVETGSEPAVVSVTLADGCTIPGEGSLDEQPGSGDMPRRVLIGHHRISLNPPNPG